MWSFGLGVSKNSDSVDVIVTCCQCHAPTPTELSLRCPDVGDHILCYDCVEIHLQAFMRDSMQVWNGGNCRFCCPVCVKKLFRRPGSAQYPYTALAIVTRKSMFVAYVNRVTELYRQELCPRDVEEASVQESPCDCEGDAFWELGVTDDDEQVDCISCTCSICLVDGNKRGLHCQQCKGDCNCHFVCSECIVSYAQAHCRADGTAAISPHGKLHCPLRTGLGCHAEPYCMYQLARIVGEKEFLELLHAERRHIESDCLQKEQALMKATSRSVAGLVHHIREEILTLKCPNRSCQQAFVDFDGCFAITCGRCRTHFCGWCMREAGSAALAHSHVTKCGVAHHNGRKKELYGLFSDFERAQAGRRLRLVDDFFRNMDIPEEVQVEVNGQLRSEFESLGMLKESARESYPEDDQELSSPQESESVRLAAADDGVPLFRRVELADRNVRWQMRREVDLQRNFDVFRDLEEALQNILGADVEQMPMPLPRREIRWNAFGYADGLVFPQRLFGMDRARRLYTQVHNHIQLWGDEHQDILAWWEAQYLEQPRDDGTPFWRRTVAPAMLRKFPEKTSADVPNLLKARWVPAVFPNFFPRIPSCSTNFRERDGICFRRRRCNRLRSSASSVTCSIFSSSSSINRVRRRVSTPLSQHQLFPLAAQLERIATATACNG